MLNFSKEAKVTISSLKAVDNETLTGATLDMSGYDSVAWSVIALKGEILAFTIKAQQGAASDMSDAADLEGTSVAFSTAVAADGQALLDLHRPAERYVRAVIAVPDAAAATPTACIAIQYNAKTLPQTNTNAELHVTPAEGTA